MAFSSAVKIGQNFNKRQCIDNVGVNDNIATNTNVVTNVNHVKIYFKRGDEKFQLYAEGVPEGLLRRFSSVGREQLAPIKLSPGETQAANPKRVSAIYAELDAEVFPSAKSWEIIRDWMNSNRHIQMPQPALKLLPPPSVKAPLYLLIDTYAAALGLRILPRAAALKDLILERIHQEALTAVDMEFLWTHLPHQDFIIKRMVKTYFGHEKAGHLTEEQTAAIYDYTTSVPELDQMFLDVEYEREQHAATVAAEREHRQKAFELRQKRREHGANACILWSGNDIAKVPNVNGAGPTPTRGKVTSPGEITAPPAPRKAVRSTSESPDGKTDSVLGNSVSTTTN